VSTERQIRANATNATKSTGPRTAEGRAVSSGNARRHGLNTPPSWDETSAFLFLITGDGDVNPLSLDERSHAALALAEAEARVARCVTAERRHLAHMAELAAQKPSAVAEKTAKEADATEDEQWERRFSPDWKKHQVKKTRPPSDPNRPAARHQTLKSLMRYRREAEAQRRKALRRWLEAEQTYIRNNVEEPLNS
jgi:hypothetical protein